MPYTSITMGGVALLCFPHWDPVFAGEVRRRFGELQASTPEALEERLRRTFPLAVVHARDDLASFVGTAWYVYRDGRYSPFSQPTAWWRTSTPRLILADDGAYLDATDPALSPPRGEPRRAPRGAFGRLHDAGVPGDVPWVLQLLRDTGELHSMSMLRPHGGDRTSPSSTTSPVTGTAWVGTSRRSVSSRPRPSRRPTIPGGQAGVSGAWQWSSARARRATTSTTTVERVEAGEGLSATVPRTSLRTPSATVRASAPTQPAGMPSDEAGHHEAASATRRRGARTASAVVR